MRREDDFRQIETPQDCIKSSAGLKLRTDIRAGVVVVGSKVKDVVRGD